MKVRVPSKRWRIALAPLAVGMLSVLVFGGTRELFFFNLQQIVPARAGSTYFSIWHVPGSCYTTDVMYPYWRRWAGEYERRKGDWRIHAARAFQPNAVWTGVSESKGYDATEDSRREYEIARKLASERPELLAAWAMLLEPFSSDALYDRVKYIDRERVINPNWSPPEVDEAKLAQMQSAFRTLKKLDPDNGYPHLLESWLLFSLGRDEQAFDALDHAMASKETRSYGLDLAANSREFLRSVGTLNVEAHASAPEWRQSLMQPARYVAHLLVTMGEAKRSSGDHIGAIKLFRSAAFALRQGLRRGDAARSALHQISPAPRDVVHHERVPAALNYLRGHGASDLADKLFADSSEVEGKDFDIGWNMFLWALGYVALFSCALLFLQMVVLGIPALAAALVRRGTDPADSGTGGKVVSHIMPPLLLVATVCIGTVASMPYYMETFPGPLGDPAIVWRYFLPAVLFVVGVLLAAGLGAKTGRERLRLWKERSPDLLLRYAIPRALVYCGYAYVVLVWTAYILRQEGLHTIM
jgi:tetratricopeptide (TPR) repeat protein